MDLFSFLFDTVDGALKVFVSISHDGPIPVPTDGYFSELPNELNGALTSAIQFATVCALILLSVMLLAVTAIKKSEGLTGPVLAVVFTLSYWVSFFVGTFFGTLVAYALNAQIGFFVGLVAFAYPMLIALIVIFAKKIAKFFKRPRKHAVSTEPALEQVNAT